MASSQCAPLRRPLPTFVWSRAQGCGSGYMARIPAGSEEGRKPGVKGDRLLLLLSEQQKLAARLSDSQRLNVRLGILSTSSPVLNCDTFWHSWETENKAFRKVRTAKTSPVETLLRVDCCCMVSFSCSSLHRPLL